MRTPDELGQQRIAVPVLRVGGNIAFGFRLFAIAAHINAQGLHRADLCCAGQGMGAAFVRRLVAEFVAQVRLLAIAQKVFRGLGGEADPPAQVRTASAPRRRRTGGDLDLLEQIGLQRIAAGGEAAGAHAIGLDFGRRQLDAIHLQSHPVAFQAPHVVAGRARTVPQVAGATGSLGCGHQRLIAHHIGHAGRALFLQVFGCDGGGMPLVFCFLGGSRDLHFRQRGGRDG